MKPLAKKWTPKSEWYWYRVTFQHLGQTNTVKVTATSKRQARYKVYNGLGDEQRIIPGDVGYDAIDFVTNGNDVRVEAIAKVPKSKEPAQTKMDI